MTMTSIIAEGLTSTVIGMGIVFGVLTLLMFILSLFKYLEPENKAPAAEMPKPAIVPETTETPLIEEQEYESAQDDGELVAVISAALAMYMDEGVVPVIKSIKPVQAAGSSRAWNTAAIRENHRGLY